MSDRIVEHDICRPRGDTFAEVFRIKAAGVIQDITGSTIRVAVNANKDPSGEVSPAPGEQFTLATGGAGVTIPVGTDGIFTFTPTALQSNIAPGTYYYDVEWNDGSEIRTIMRGKWIVEQDRTKV